MSCAERIYHGSNCRCDWCSRFTNELKAKRAENVEILLCNECSNHFDKVNEAGVMNVY